ncbi:MAG: TonB-dependent receptor [Luteitalea sp.]|nr:TonB-dependent receptor [Luteitalea sp.]
MTMTQRPTGALGQGFLARWRPPVTLLICAALFLAGSAQAQPNDPAVSGRIVDASGWAVPGVSVILRRPASGFEQTATTDSDGHYGFDQVPDGAYSITALLPGFSVARKEVVLGREPVVVQFTLRTGSFAEDVTALGSRLVGSEETLRRTPGSVDVLTRDALEASHVFTTNEALRKVPGLHARDDEGLGLRPHIGIRGLSPGSSVKALLLEDGVPTAYAPYGDNASVYHPPIERFARVEVMKGSGQISHGPVTVGGVLNYITPDPPVGRSTSVSLSGGSRDYFNGHLSFGGTWGTTGLLFDVMRKQSDGAREHQHADLNDFTVKVASQLTPEQGVSFKMNYYGEDAQLGLSGLRDSEYIEDPRQNPFVDDELDASRSGFTGTYRALVKNNLALTTTGYVQVYRPEWWWQSSHSGQRPRNPADPRCVDPIDVTPQCGNQGRSSRYTVLGIEPRVRIDHSLFGLSQETDVGARLHAEIQERQLEKGATPTARTGILLEDNRRTTDAASAFLQHRFLLGAWTITPGVRVEHMRHERVNRLGNEGTGVTGNATLTEVVPGLGIAYAMSARVTGFAGIHRGFAPPRVEDLIANDTGSATDLEAERSWNTEVGARALVAPGLRVDASFFQIEYENQIIAANLAGGEGSTLTNGGETLHRGLESALSFDSATLTRGSNNIYARLAGTWVPVARLTGVRLATLPGGELVSVSGNRVPYAPESLVSFTLGYRRTALLDVQVEAQHLGQQFGDTLNTVPSSVNGQQGLIPAYTLWNAAATWYVSRPRVSFFVAVKNLADRTFIVDRSRGILPSIPRLVQAGLSWRF